MSQPAAYVVRQLTDADVETLRELLAVFGHAFRDVGTYTQAQPDAAYLRKLLGGEYFIALVALDGDAIAGGIAAYELPKFEQARSEIYIYDLAVAEPHRRKGVATALITKLQSIAAERRADVIFVQADLPDAPAIALYSNLGRREDVIHFDIPVGWSATTRRRQ